jgi:hypothetical protein
MVVPYSPEFRAQGTDMRFLKLLAQTGGGVLLDASDNASAFAQDLKPATASIPITFWLLILAALLLPLDIAARRLASLDFLAEGYRWLLARLRPGVSPAVPTATSPQRPALAPLSQMRVKRQQARSQVVPSARDTSNIQRVKPTNDQPRPTPQKASREPEVQPTSHKTTSSMASRLVEAKRQREQEKQ